MPAKHCCYGNCNSDSRYILKRPDMNGVTFIPFPKPKTQLEKCQRWVRLCGRQYFTVESIRKETYICSKHFVGGNGPTDAHPDPLPAVSTNFERHILSSKKKRKAPTARSSPKKKRPRKRLISQVPDPECPDNIDMVGTSTCSDKLETVVIEHDYACFPASDHDHDEVCETISCTQESETEEIWCDAVSEFPCVAAEEEIATLTSMDASTCTETDQAFSSEVGTQTDVCFDHIRDYTDDELIDRKQMSRKLFLTSVLKDNNSCKFYTGLNLSIFLFLFEWIRAKAGKLNYWKGQDTSESKNARKAGPKRKLSLKEEFVITLVRLKRGLDVEVLGDLVGVHPSSISRIFTTWINFLYLELKFLISWPTKEQVTANLPKAFKHFRRTRSIIDCTEFFVQKPSIPSSQRVTWSNYKHHNTLKALVSISPTGAFTFISKLFTGSISDRRIVEESGYLEYLEHGDDVMADRGFLIRDLLARRSCTLNIPPFSMGKPLSSKAVTKTRRIASARIHVERAIGRLNTFKILQGTMPLRLHPLFDQVVGVCACLCNLDAKLVK